MYIEALASNIGLVCLEHIALLWMYLSLIAKCLLLVIDNDPEVIIHWAHCLND